MAAHGFNSNVSVGFHYETKYVLLCYLSLPPRSHSRSEEGASGQTVLEKNSNMKKQIEERLKQLEDEITASFPSTGFDRHTSPVFSPVNPENAIEDSLALLGDRVTQVLDTHLASAIQTHLSGQLDYDNFQSAVKEISSHSERGWSKVLVPLVFLQALHCKGQPLASLLALGEQYLIEEEAEFIIQQGGWSAVFGLEDVEEPGVLIAEDSNDIYILSGEQSREQLSSPESLLISAADSSNLSSWHTESLPVSLSGHDSWAQVSTMEPEDAKSVDSGEGVASAEERSENNSSNSDIVHVEREEAELLEEGEAGEEEDLQESVLSVLGSESEMEALRDEFRKEVSFPQQPVLEASESLMSLEDQLVILEAPPSLIAAVPSVEPKSLSSLCPSVISSLDAPESFTPLPLNVTQPEHLSVAALPQVLDPKPEPAQSEPVPAPVESLILRTVQEPEAKSEPQPEAHQAAAVLKILSQETQARIVQAVTTQGPPPILLVPAQEIPTLETQIQKSLAPSQIVLPTEQEILLQKHKRVQTASVPAQESPTASSPSDEPVSSEFSYLLYGGAALVAIVALVAYGALVHRKK